MTSPVENRVVQMQFDNARFEQRLNQTIASLDRLNKTLQLTGATRGLTDIGNAAANQASSLQNIEQSAQSISDRFKAMGVVGVTALATVAHSAITAGSQFLKSFTFAPIMEGFREYETNINSIQTILANTGLEGEKGLAKVNSALDELNHYSDQTIYNFSEMARNIGTFTAAGVELDTATSAIKGIANLAAISGSNSEQASTVMYQLSQAISAGTATLEDWNSVVNAGMGGKVFQEALKDTARVHGVAIDDMIKDAGSFRLSLQEGWLTGEILTETLQKFTGDLTKSQLKSMGYNEEQIRGILKMGNTARDAATKVKTMSQLINTLQEGLSSGWAKTWQTVFGDFNEAKTLFTEVGTVLGGFVDSSNDARNKVLGDWKELGGRTVLIDGIKNAFEALMSVIRPIKEAFREIFPATTGRQLYEMTVTFRDFMERLKLGEGTAENLRRTFAGFFAVLGIGWEIVKQVAKTIFGLFETVGEGSGGFLKSTASVGDFLVALHKAIKEGEGLTKFFEGLGAILAVPIRLVQRLGGYLVDLFEGGGTDSTSAGKNVGEFTDKLDVMARVGEKITDIWENIGNVMDRVWSGVQTIGSNIADFFDNFGSGIGEELQDLDLTDVFAGINTGLFGALVLALRNFLSGGGGGLMEGITDSIEAFTGVLKSMQTTLRAATLLQIALAVGILALAMSTLSEIDQEGLTRAGTAIGALFAQLVTSLLVFEKISGFKGFAKMPFVATSMILLGVAINILAIAVKNLSELSWEELGKGLTGVIGLLGALVGVSQLMGNPGKMIATGLGMIALAAAIKLLADSVTDLSGLSWEEMAQGLVGVGALLGALTLFTRFSKASAAGLAQGAGIVLLAFGIKLLADALKDISKLSWGELGKGMAGLAGGLAIIAAALKLIPAQAILGGGGVLLVALSLGMVADALDEMGQMSWSEIGRGLTAMLGAMTIIAAALYVIPPAAILGAAGVLIVAFALKEIAKVLDEMAQFSWEEIGKSMTMLAGTLGIIAAALFVMQGALPGAAAVLIVAASLAILAPVLMQFSQMSLAEIGTSLLMLAGVFAVFGAAAFILAPVVPVMIGLGAAVALLGIGMLAAGAGVLLFATALTALAAAGVASTAAIVGIVAGLVGLIPMVMEQIGLGLIAFAEVIGESGPAITRAITEVLNALLDAIEEVTPRAVELLLEMLVMMYNKMADYVPQMVDAGLRLLTGVLDGIADNIDDVVDSAVDIVTEFIDAIGDAGVDIIDAGAEMIIDFINGVADSIDEHSEELGEAGANLAEAIIEGMVDGLAAGGGEILDAAKNMAQNALDGAMGLLGIHSPSREFNKIGKFVVQGFRQGIDGNKQEINQAFSTLKGQLRQFVSDSKQEVKRLEQELKQLRDSDKKEDKRRAAKIAAQLAREKREQAAAQATYEQLSKRLDDEQRKLGRLADRYDELTGKIERAQQRLQNAIRTRDDYNKQIKDQYSDIPSATGETKVADYIADLKKQVEDTKVFANALARLRDLGINDEMYKDLLATGPEALPFVQELLAGGKRGVNQINALNKELNKTGKALGKEASSELYQAAVDSARGIVDGLKKQRKAIEEQMDRIADAMVKALKKKLGIKSPSKVFAELGGYSAQGLTKGFKDSTGDVAKSAEDMGDTAIDSLRKSLSKMAEAVDGEIDTKPVISPVLDLDGVKKDATKIGGMLDTASISASSAYNKAKIISQSQANASSSGPTTKDIQPSVVYNQYNNSPKALSSADIYRQTKNQLSTAKGALST